MQNLSKSQLGVMVLLLLIMYEGIQATTLILSPDIEKLKPSLQKIEQMTQLRKEMEALDNSQFGFCDTCVASYRSAIAENRLACQELSRQNLLLQTKVLAMKKLNLRVDSLLRVYAGH